MEKNPMTNPMKQILVTARDGTELAVQEWGNPSGLEVLLVHGFNQSHLSWARQVSDPVLLEACRFIAFDLRGHGASGKPERAEAYSDSTLWAADVTAVIDATALKRPVVVGWSYAGRVVGDFLRHGGAERIAGVNFTGAVLKNERAFMGPGRANYPDMSSDDLATSIAGTQRFARACFEVRPLREDFELILAFNMMVPPRVRKFLLENRSDPADVLPKLDLPVLLTHGEKDQIILAEMSRFAAGIIPGAKLSVYPTCGHAPFYEDALRFNRELLAFVRDAQAKSKAA
jgi:non-heme chloroperoxidase